MSTLWRIESDQNPGLFLASFAPGPSRWVEDDKGALPFSDEGSALLVITVLLAGKGRAVRTAA
jgi:hypothetical protein